MIITVVVPISSGSKRVKDNDLRPFVDTTFWENKIKDFLKLPDKGLWPKLSTKLRKCFLNIFGKRRTGQWVKTLKK